MQTCGWCGRDRKDKHFKPGSTDCKDCRKQQKNQRLAGTGPNPNAGFGGMSSPTGALIPQSLTTLLGQMGHPTGGVGGAFAQSAPPKPKRKRRYRATHQSASDGSTAMLVSQDDTTITLVNEDDFEWSDPLDQWVPIERPKPVHSVEEVSTFVDSGAIDKIELQLKYGMNDEGKPLSVTERADLEDQYNRLLFGRSAPPSADEEAEALKSILGGAQ